MILGFTGTQYGMSPEQELFVREFLAAHQPHEAHHGDCVGADERFHELVRVECSDCVIVTHPPEDASKRAHRMGDRERVPKPYLVRDVAIVNACEHLLATPQRAEKGAPRSGTWYTVRRARARKRPITIVFRDGRVVRENQ